MDSQVCVNCGNKKPVNGTSNRLVTESCGHVKCMQCLLEETSGCSACKAKNGNTNENKTKLEYEHDNSHEVEVNITEENRFLDLPLLKENTRRNYIYDVENVRRGNKLNTSHIKVETEGNMRKYTCTICNKTYTSRSQTIYHAYCNGQKKPYQCTHPYCENKNKGFVSLSHYNYHMRMHNGERQYKCDVCNEGFVLKSKLQRHKLKHTTVKKFQCNDCGRGFNNRSALRKHMRLHSGEAPYRCQHCGRKFTDSSNYRKHLRRHERGAITVREPRPFKCTECDQTFKQLPGLKRHAYVHIDKKPFGCNKCDSAFRRKDNLKRHLRNSVVKHNGDGGTAVTNNGGHVNTTQNGTETKTSNGSLNGNKTLIAKPIKPIKMLTPDEENEKAKLEVLNPLPPLPKEIIQKHLYDKEKESKIDKSIDKQKETEIDNSFDKEKGIKTDKTYEKEVKIDKSYILEANNARQSVITKAEPKMQVPVTEYVHKIRKANSLSCRKEVPLPPIDEAKFIELTTSSKTLDVGPLPKNIQMYKKILDDKSEKSGEEKVPEVHWRKKRLTDKE